MTVGWLFPSLFAAPYTEALARKLPFVLRWTVWERVPFLALAALAFLLAERAPAATLALLLALLLVTAVIGGVLMPAWLDIVGRAVPGTIRGRFFALANAAGNVGGVLGSVLTAWVLAVVAPPASFGVCFLGAALFMGLSYAALALVREPPASPPPARVPLRAYLRRVPGIIRRDRDLAWYLAARALGVAGTMAGAFYTVHGLRAFDAPAWQVGVFTGALLGGQLAGNTVLGWVADRAGHRRVMLAGGVAMVAANGIALAAPSVDVFTTVFVLAGVQLAAVNVSGFNILLEFAPTASERPTYVGLGTTTVAPVAFGAPLVAGVVADALGLGVVFATAGAAATAGVVMLATAVRDPRYRSRSPSP